MDNSSDRYSAPKQALGALFIAISVIVAAALLSGAWKKTHPTHDNIISVTGLANEDFQSDLIVWTGSFSQHAMTMKDAYEALKKNAAAIKAYLVGKGVKETEIVFSAVDINRDFKTIRNEKGAEIGQEFTGYTLKQGVTIESHEVNKIETVSREVTELIDQGVELYSQDPHYYYTKLAELKIKMLSAATADARLRAEKIATNAKGSLGSLRNATMGIFQITAQNSSEEYTYGGAFNTSSKWKTASITVKLEFSVE
ncbi:MAG: SIMPL domain-containing protein [Candidatus Kapaibacterium sp.]|jgi:hypothetical protein